MGRIVSHCLLVTNIVHFLGYLQAPGGRMQAVSCGGFEALLQCRSLGWPSRRLPLEASAREQPRSPAGHRGIHAPVLQPTGSGSQPGRSPGAGRERRQRAVHPGRRHGAWVQRGATGRSPGKALWSESRRKTLLELSISLIQFRDKVAERRWPPPSARRLTPGHARVRLLVLVGLTSNRLAPFSLREPRAEAWVSNEEHSSPGIRSG